MRKSTENMSGDIIDLSKPSGAGSDKSSGKRPTAKRYTDEDRQRAIELYKSGKSKSEVSKQLGIPGGTVRGWLKSAVIAGLIQQVSSNENSNSSNSDTDVCLISDGAGEAHGTITKEAVLSNAKSLKDNKTMDDSSPQNFMLQKFFEYMAQSGEASNPSVETSTADSTSEKRKRDCEEGHDTGKRIKSEAAEPSASWQQTPSSLQALSSMSPTNLHHQQPAAHQGVVKPKPVVPVASSALPGYPQNATPMPDPSINYYQQQQQLISYYQQHLIAQQQQEQQQLHNQHQQQRQQQEKQQQQYQQQQHQQHQHYQQKHQQQPNASYYNHQPQHLVTSNYSSDAPQAAATLLSSALSTPKSSGRGKKRAPTAMAQPTIVEQYIQAYQHHLNQLVAQNMLIQGLQQQQINIPSSLQITPVTPLQMQQTPPMQSPTLPLQNPALALHNPALSLQHSGPARSKSRNDTASPRPAASYSPLHRGHSPLARVQSPLTGSHSPRPSSTPNSQQQGVEHHQQETYEQQQQKQQYEQQSQYENRQQYEERELVPDSAYQSQDSQSSSVPASQEKPNSPIQVENVDGITSGDGGQLMDLTMQSAPTSIMNPLKIKGKRRRKKKADEVDVCDNVMANAEPAEDLHDYLLKQSERIGEEFVGDLQI